MKNEAVLIGCAAVLLAAMFSEPGHPLDELDELESPETWGEYDPEWGHEWTAVSVALNPDGSVSRRLPDFVRERLETLIARFEQRFGSATKHGLLNGQVVSEKFCPPEASVHWGDMLARHLGAALLLSEVAVEATIDSVAFGFNSGGGPAALIRLADVEPLTSRSPVPEYAVLTLGQLVVGDRVFCGERGPLSPRDHWLEKNGEVPYQPIVGSRVVLIGAWRGGTVFFDPMHDSWYAEVKSDGELRWVYGFQGRSLDGLKGRIAELDAAGLFDRTHSLARPEADPHARMDFARNWSALVDRGCRPAGFSESGDGSLEPRCELEE